MMGKLKSYKVFAKKTGNQIMTVVIHKDYTLEELNDLFQNGMSVVVVDQRSHMVNKKFVDKD